MLLTAAGNALNIPVKSGSVQLAAGSPPYQSLRFYGKKNATTATGSAWMDWPEVSYSPMPGEPQRLIPPWRGQLGHEPFTRRIVVQPDGSERVELVPEMYVAHLVEIAREVRRTLHETGLMVLNIGDTCAEVGLGRAFLGIPWRTAFALQADRWILRSAVIWEANRLPQSVSGWRWEQCRAKAREQRSVRGKTQSFASGSGRNDGDNPGGGIDQQPWATWQPCPGCPKCEKTNGLVLRRGSWRPTTSTEMVFIFAKSPGYWASGEGVRENAVRGAAGSRFDRGATGLTQSADRPTGGPPSPGYRENAGRNLRDVWRLPETPEEIEELARQIGMQALNEGLDDDALSDQWYIVTEPSKERHYAGWPSALARRLIQFATPDAGCCRECGVPWSEVVERELTGQTLGDVAGKEGAMRNDTAAWSGRIGDGRSSVLGWLPSCGCRPLPPTPLSASEARKLTRPAVVLDMFGGTGTTAREARAMGRSAVTVDPILEYCQMARDNAGWGCVDTRQERPRALAPIEGPLFA